MAECFHLGSLLGDVTAYQPERVRILQAQAKRLHQPALPKVVVHEGSEAQRNTVGVYVMRIQELATDVVMFVGDDVESVATAFMDGERALLVD